MHFKILVIDDDQDIREVAQMISSEHLKERATTEYFHASNGLEALNICFEHKFDLIFCDIKMPKMDGLSFMKILREGQSQNADTWTIVFSGAMESVEAKEDQGLDRSYLLKKPFSAKSMGNALNIWMASEMRKI